MCFSRRRSWLKMTIHAHLERFLGCDPLNVVIYCPDCQHAHLWPEPRVLAYRSSRSVQKCDLGAWRNKRKRWKLQNVAIAKQNCHVF